MNTATPLLSTKTALIFMASPRKNGFTAGMLDQLLAKLPADINCKTIFVPETNITPCTDCRACLKGECPFNNDGMGDILEQVMTADLIIAASPIYFNHVPAKFKAIFDRLQQLYVKKVILNTPVFTKRKAGILITSAGSDDPFAYQSMNTSFSLFFRSFNAEFLSHIALDNTDKAVSSVVPDDILDSTLRKLSSFFINL